MKVSQSVVEKINPSAREYLKTDIKTGSVSRDDARDNRKYIYNSRLDFKEGLKFLEGWYSSGANIAYDTPLDDSRQNVASKEQLEFIFKQVERKIKLLTDIITELDTDPSKLSNYTLVSIKGYYDKTKSHSGEEFLHLFSFKTPILYENL